ncbi:MAG TPA: OmpA family protein [Kofleriaceae bacterium]|nr:OmpA family protein [Kofleriaceae bacterium]
MPGPVRPTILAACLAASLAACAGATAFAPPPAPVGPSGPAKGADSPSEDGWRTYVPERCRDRDEQPRPGCRTRRVVVTETDVEILEPVAFVGNTAELTAGSHRTVEVVAQTLLADPGILVLEVRGHSDSLLHPEERAELARQRAEVVAAEIVGQGVDPARVTTYGASDSELIYPADDPRNRRVEFLIVARDE